MCSKRLLDLNHKNQFCNYKQHKHFFFLFQNGKCCRNTEFCILFQFRFLYIFQSCCSVLQSKMNVNWKKKWNHSIYHNSSHFVRVRKAKFFEALNSAEGDLSTREFIKDGVKSIILQASAQMHTDSQLCSITKATSSWAKVPQDVKDHIKTLCLAW